MTNPTSRFKPAKEAPINIRLRGLEPMVPVHLPPREPAVEGLLSLFLALWQLISLTHPSTVFVSSLPSLTLGVALLITVYWTQPYKRAMLGLYNQVLASFLIFTMPFAIYRAIL